MRNALVTLLIVWIVGPAAQAKPVSGRVYYLGIALDQEGAAGTWAQVGNEGDWKATLAGTVLNGKLYTAESGGGLFVTDLENGAWQQLGKPDFAATKFMFNSGGSLYTIETNGNLFRVDPSNGAWTQIGANGDWANTRGAAVLNGRLFTVESSGKLFCTDLSNGSWRPIGNPDFATTRFMFSDNRNALYTIEQDGSLYRVNSGDGSWSVIGQRGAWKAAISAVILGGRLYTAESSGKLFSTDLHSGRRGAIGNADFGATKFMFPAGGKLYTIESSGSLFRIAARAGQEIDAFDCFATEFEHVFKSQGEGLRAGFESRTVTGKKATHAAILDAFAWLRREPGPDDLAIVYFTAHGGTDPKTGWAITTADLKTLYAREIKAELAQVRCPVIFFLETCECGGFAAPHENDPPVPPNVTALCACTAIEITNNPLDIAAIEALEGRADFNGDGVVDLDEVIRYMEARYKEWWPAPGDGANEPVIARGARVPGSLTLTLTHNAKSVIAVSVNDELWSALDEGAQGEQLKVHLLGWPGASGKPYFITNLVARDHACLPQDGETVQVNSNGHWRAARLLHADGGKITVHYFDDHPSDDTVPANEVRYPFAGQARGK